MHLASKAFNNDRLEVHPELLWEVVALGRINERLVYVFCERAITRVPPTVRALCYRGLPVGVECNQGLNAVGKVVCAVSYAFGTHDVDLQQLT